MWIEPPPSPQDRLGPNDVFSFSCRDTLPCFNSCCRNKHLPLTPYDVLRLKRALKQSSDQFLADYTLYRLDPRSGFPILTLKMQEDAERSCIFVSPEGCRVYEHRPTACRLFPLARGFRPEAGAWYSVMRIPGCRGFEEDQEWRVETWVQDQQLDPYLEMNDRMAGLAFHPAKKRDGPLSGSQLQKVLVAAYNLDVFRAYIFETPFLSHHPVDPRIRDCMKTDDEALLGFSMTYLERSLFPSVG